MTAMKITSDKQNDHNDKKMKKNCLILVRIKMRICSSDISPNHRVSLFLNSHVSQGVVISLRLSI